MTTVKIIFMTIEVLSNLLSHKLRFPFNQLPSFENVNQVLPMV